MEEYKSNSMLPKEVKPKEEVTEKKLDKVVTGPVKVRKKSGLRKFADDVIQEDVRNVKSYIFTEVIIPAIKTTISDVVSNGIDMILYGETRGRRGGSGRGLSKISYRDYYDRDRRKDRDRERRPAGYDFDEIIFNNKGEAEAVLFRMDEIIDRYGVVTVADFYELAGEPGKWTDNKYGWMDLRDVSPVRVRDGYIIPLPKVRAID